MGEKRTFGWRPGAKVSVEIGDDGYVTVKGSLGADRARVPLADIETVTVRAGSIGQGPANMRQTFLQLIGHGTVLGQAAVNTFAGRAGAVEEAADWLREQVQARRAPA